MTLAIYEREKIRIAAALTEERARHEKAIATLRTEYQLADEQAKIIVAGLDDSKILHADHVIYVSGDFAKAGEDRLSQREAAIADLLADARRLRERYFGTKDYAHWHGQSSDHTYGFGPKHGSVIFQIGLQSPVRERTSTPLLAEDEVDAAVYYLRNLERIQAAQVAARQLAAAA